MGKKFKSENGKTYSIPFIIDGIEDDLLDISDFPADVQTKVRKVRGRRAAEPTGVVISGRIIRETAKAIRFSVVGDDGMHGTYWIPRSQVVVSSEHSLMITEWIYSKKCAE